MNYNEQQTGALERMGIPVETTTPDGVMTSGAARSVRFRTSRPQGYAFGDVESFLFDHIIPSFEWYANVLHQRDLAVHKLGEYIDKLEVDILNLSAQLENKQYNEALGIAVEQSEGSDETEILLERVQGLEYQLAAAQQQLADYQNGSAPEGEFYSRADVEGYIANAVAEANAQKDAEFAETYQTYYTPEQVQQMIDDAIKNQAPVEPETETYSREDVEGYIANAVAEAIAQKDAEFTKTQTTYEQALADLNAERETAVIAAREEAKAEVEAIPAGYSQDQVDELVAEAVRVKEEEVLASLPAEGPQAPDHIAELTDEGDLGLRAEVRTLKESLAQMVTYVSELEDYVSQVEGTAGGNATDTPINTATGRPMPKIRPEDL